MLLVYISSISGNPKVKSNQLYVMNLLSALHVPFEVRDISTSEKDKLFMSEALKSRGKQVIAPQLFSDEEYIGVSFTHDCLHLKVLL
ncbi:SH3 domain-binding glutamic acid-rich protein [Fasciolopsis buskii]|uniref:SH3 domain-binding glutamic acid-rich protein n=1 Tax=Fasciolopsis buskii TaxID=27845 RepID=A0A8E0S481_9TREM|nr:SH3 domain-binding glutamic acid-rich protein [Fasciolopsis buski]